MGREYTFEYTEARILLPSGRGSSKLFLTGTDIKYYPSAIIEFILETRRAWIKHVRIEVFDNDNKKIKDGIETYSEEIIRDRLSNSKLDMLNYTSTFVNWDVDNINIIYIS